MKMLDEIIAGAVDHNFPIATVLRKCLILAHTLKNEKLKSWVQSELNGYDDPKALPDYRIASVQAVGTFLGTFNRQINNQPLPSNALKEAHRDWAQTAYLQQPVAAYETTVKDPETKSVQFHWPANLVVLYQHTFFPDQGYTLNRAHQVIPISCLVGLVESVRNRLLQFALEIKNEIGSSDATPTNPPPAEVEKLVVNIIQGGQTNVYGGSIGGDVIQGVHQTVVKGDFATLSGALQQIGFPDTCLGELKAALDADGQAGHKTGIGPKVAGWIKSSIKALATGTLKVGADVAEKVVTAAVLAYLGPGPAG
jgi:hypothetical protein